MIYQATQTTSLANTLYVRRPMDLNYTALLHGIPPGRKPSVYYVHNIGTSANIMISPGIVSTS